MRPLSSRAVSGENGGGAPFRHDRRGRGYDVAGRPHARTAAPPCARASRRARGRSIPYPIYMMEQPAPLEPFSAARMPASSTSRWRPHIEWPTAAAILYYAVTAALLLRLIYGYLFARRLVAASRREGSVGQTERRDKPACNRE